MPRRSLGRSSWPTLASAPFALSEQAAERASWVGLDHPSGMDSLYGHSRRLMHACELTLPCTSDDQLDAALLASPPSLDTFSHSPTPKVTSFRLLDLPTELISNVCRFVALLKYSYSESRRPRPSTLALLGSCNSLLRELTSATLWRSELGFGLGPVLWPPDNHPAGPPPHKPKFEHCRYVRITFFSPPDVKSALVDVQNHGARYAKVTSLTLVVPPPDPAAEIPLSAHDILSPLSIFQNIVQLSIRLSAGANRSLALDTSLPALPNLVAVSLRGCHTSWLATFADLPDVKSLHVTLAGEQPLVGWMPTATWGRLGEFAMEVSPTLGGVSPLDEALFGLRVRAQTSYVVAQDLLGNFHRYLRMLACAR